jgi:hypothetical protein
MDMKKPPKDQIEMPEIDPDKWGQFESTLKRALSMKPKPHTTKLKVRRRKSRKT